ncbi:MAG TPA: hypothetical protein DEG47_07565 [Cyanobacteria bacterium UBA11148]|nr:hypothetical protein [Cyanobacteria bacterium UBA11148]
MTSLRLSGNALTDAINFSPLLALTKLTHLSLDRNNIKERTLEIGVGVRSPKVPRLSTVPKIIVVLNFELLIAIYLDCHWYRFALYPANLKIAVDG